MRSSVGAQAPAYDRGVRLYLASTSPARFSTLRNVGIEPITLAPGVDEEAAVAAREAELGHAMPAAEMVQLLARLKAEAIVGAEPGGHPIDGFILGGDSAFELDGVVYGKPHRPEVALERWQVQRGRSGVLHSGHWVIDHRGGAVRGAVGRATSAIVHFASDIEDAELEAYIATGEPLTVAGAFTIDSKGAAFIDRIEGDPHTVVGLSVPLLRVLVHELGGRFTDLWNR